MLVGISLNSASLDASKEQTIPNTSRPLKMVTNGCLHFVVTPHVSSPEGRLTRNKAGGRTAAPGFWQGLWRSAGAHIGLELELAAQKR